MKKILISVLIFTLAQGIFAQKSFNDLVNLPAKKLNKAINVWGKNDWRPDTKLGTGITPDLSQKEIKKVALVSFTISIPHIYTEKFLTEVGNKYFVNKMYDMSIESLKQSFSKGGIELITVDNMTREQKAILSGAEARDKIFATSLDIKQSKLEKHYEDVQEKGISAGNAADGYKSWLITDRLPLSWDLNVFGALAEAMKVDAILFVNNNVIPESRTLTFQKTIMTMIGVNPIPKVEGKKYPGLSYLHGLPYGQTSIGSDFEIASFKRKKIASESMEGYDKLLVMLADKMIEYLKINTERSKVKYKKDHK
jgi:hypothetical protein